MATHVTGSMDRLGPRDVEHFLKSLWVAGHTGCVTMMVRNLTARTRRWLEQAGVDTREVHGSRLQIVVDRFKTLADYCDELDPDDWVLAVDTTDIVFQRHPCGFLNTVPRDKRIIVASECIQFQFNWWTSRNMVESYPEHWRTMKDELLYNAGSIAGRASDLGELARDVYEMSLTRPHAKGHDQAAMNILLRTPKYRDRTLFARANDGWCYCMASTWCASEHERRWLQEPLCRFNGHVCVTENGTIPVMLHHYNRDKRINRIVRKAVEQAHDEYASDAERLELLKDVRRLLATTGEIMELLDAREKGCTGATS